MLRLDINNTTEKAKEPAKNVGITNSNYLREVFFIDKLSLDRMLRQTLQRKIDSTLDRSLIDPHICVLCRKLLKKKFIEPLETTVMRTES